MRVTATQYEESVVCTLPEGKEIEIIMISAEGDDYCAEPDLNSAPSILAQLKESGSGILESISANAIASAA